MSKHLIVVLQLAGLILMANGAVSTPASYGAVVVGGMIAVVGGIEYRRRVRQEQG